MSSIPWCIVGDFNDLLSNEDKCGRVEHPSWLLSGFCNVIPECNLIDVQLEGYPFTWWKGEVLVEQWMNDWIMLWLQQVGSIFSRMPTSSTGLLLSPTTRLFFFLFLMRSR